MTDFPELRFNDHVKSLRWEQGQHVFIAGPTGSGKTTLAKSLLEKRSHVLGFGIKAKDDTLKKEFADWHFVQSFDEIESWDNRVMLWPRPKRRETGNEWRARKRKEFKYAFDRMIKSGGWGIYIDELAYMSHPKFGGVADEIGELHFIGRSAGTSILSGVQRPAWVPLSVMASASHAYIARTNLAEDIKRLGDLGGVDRRELERALRALRSRHDFVYQPTLVEGRQGIVNTRK